MDAPAAADVVKVLDTVKQFTKSSAERLAAMTAALRSIDESGLPGDVVECGVWRGGNIALARLTSPERIVWAYDTYQGMTRPEDVDTNWRGGSALDDFKKKQDAGGLWSAVPLAMVQENLRVCGAYDEEKLRFVVGPVEETLLCEANLPERIALLRLDTDWHASTKIEMEVLYPRLVPGGILIVDDYGHWMGAKKAVDDYFGWDKPVMRMIDYTAVMMVKP